MAVDGTSGRRLRPRRVFGLAAVFDLLVRYSDWGVAVARLDPTLPVVSVLAGIVDADTTGVIVVVVGLYRYGPALLSPLEARVAETEGFDAPSVSLVDARAVRVCIAILAVAVFEGGSLSTNPTSSVVATVFYGSVMIASVSVFPLYCRRRYGWRLADPDGYLARLLGALVPFNVREDFRRDLAADGMRAYVSRGAWLVAIGTLVVFPGITVGMLLPVLLFSFPLPDLIALSSWLLGWRRIRRWLPERLVNTATLIDPERFMIGLAVHSAGGLRRFLWGFVILAGVVTGGVLIGRLGIELLVGWLPLAVEAVATADELVATEPGAALAVVGVAWRLLGVSVVMLATATYTGWIWYRRSRRVAAQFRGDDHAPAVPPGSLLPAVVAVVAGVSIQQSLTVVGVHVGSAWPVVVVTLGTVVVRLRGTTSAVTNEQRGVVVGGLLSLLLPQLISVAMADGSTLTALVAVVTSPKWVGVEVAVVGVTYWPADTSEPATANPLRWCAPIVFAAVMVAVGLWIGVTTDSLLLRVLAAVLACLTTLFTVTRVAERRRAKPNQK